MASFARKMCSICVYMSNFVPEKVFLRGVLHYFNMKKTAAKSHCILVEVYGEHALTERTC